MFHNFLTGKANGFFLKNVNTKNSSNALGYYTSNKPIIIVLTKNDFENNEITIQQGSYLQTGQEIKSYNSNGISCKCVIFDDDNPENVGFYPNNTFNFILPNTSTFPSSMKNNIKFRKLETDIISIKYPKSSLRIMKKLKKENFKIQKFRKEAEKNLINIKNEEIKMQQIREEHKQLEIQRDILTNIIKNQNSQSINLTEFENKAFINVYAIKHRKDMG